MVEQSIDALRSDLEEERGQLTSQLADLGVGDGAEELEYDDNFADSSAVTAAKAENEALVLRLQERLDHVRAALGRMDDGTFGTCTQCGKQISAERLEAMPEVSTCVDCSRKR